MYLEFFYLSFEIGLNSEIAVMNLFDEKPKSRYLFGLRYSIRKLLLKSHETFQYNFSIFSDCFQMKGLIILHSIGRGIHEFLNPYNFVKNNGF